MQLFLPGTMGEIFIVGFGFFDSLFCFELAARLIVLIGVELIVFY